MMATSVSFLGFSIRADETSKAQRDTNGYLADELSLVKQLGFIDDSSGIAKPVDDISLSDIGEFLNWVAGGKIGVFPPLVKRFLCTRLSNMKKASMLPNATQEFKDGLIRQLEELVKNCEENETIRPSLATTPRSPPVTPMARGITHQEMNTALKVQQIKFQKALNDVKTQQDILKNELLTQITQKVASLEAKLEVAGTRNAKSSVQPVLNPKSSTGWFSFTQKKPKENTKGATGPQTSSIFVDKGAKGKPTVPLKGKNNIKFSVANPLVAQANRSSFFSRFTQKAKKPISSEPPKFPIQQPSSQPTRSEAKFSGLAGYFPGSGGFTQKAKKPISSEPPKFPIQPPPSQIISSPTTQQQATKFSGLAGYFPGAKKQMNPLVAATLSTNDERKTKMNRLQRKIEAKIADRNEAIRMGQNSLSKLEKINARKLDHDVAIKLYEQQFEISNIIRKAKEQKDQFLKMMENLEAKRSVITSAKKTRRMTRKTRSRK